jgi:hypothetical protein
MVIYAGVGAKSQDQRLREIVLQWVACPELTVDRVALAWFITGADRIAVCGAQT